MGGGWGGGTNIKDKKIMIKQKGGFTMAKRRKQTGRENIEKKKLNQ